jgi:alpha-tubulin suppressor-like RCC1 family protein
MSKVFIGRGLAVLGLVASLQLGCSGGSDVSDESESAEAGLGTATFELMMVPSSVGCVRITASGLQGEVTKEFGLSSGASTAQLLMERLPLGTLTVTGYAYDGTCANVGNSPPAWIADTETARLEPGVVSNLSLTFRKNNPVTASVNFVGNVQALAAGQYANAIIIDGLVYMWGTLGTTVYKTPTKISGTLTDMVDVAVGWDHACATKSNGQVWCWGANASGQLGPGIAKGTSSVTPVQVSTGLKYGMVAAGDGFTCAEEPAANKLWCWGKDVLSPAQTFSTPWLEDSHAIREFAASNNHVCTADSVGTQWCWGSNSNGQVDPDGSGTTAATSSGVIKSAVDVAASTYATYYVMADGTIRAWGANHRSQLGIGTSIETTDIVTVSGITTAIAVAAGGSGSHACALLESGSLKCWGDNGDGQVGNETTTDAATPITPTGLPLVERVAAGGEHTCALTRDHELYCWGRNYGYQLGDGTQDSAFKPKRIVLP